MKRLTPVLIALIVLVAAVGIGKNLIATAAVTGGVKLITGLDARIAGMQVGVLTTAIRMQGVRIFNPRGFSDRVMAEVPELFVDYKLGAFLNGKAHLEAVRLNLQELSVIKAADGRHNLEAITALEPGKVQGETQRQQQQPPKAMPFRIDVLELRVGTVVYKDYTKSPPFVQAFNVGINERYERITNPYSLGALVVTRALAKTTVARLANVDLAALQADVTAALKFSAAQLTGQLAKPLDAAKEIGGEAVGAATQAVEETVGVLKEVFGGR